MGGIYDSGDVGSLDFQPLKRGQIYRGCDVMRVDDESLIVRTSRGGLTLFGRSVQHINGKVSVLNWGIGGIQQRTLEGLAKMGAVSPQAVAEYIKRRRAKRDADAEKDNARYAARTLIRLGIVLPARLKMLCQKHGLNVAEMAREAGVE